jgi:hypothetical protein
MDNGCQRCGSLRIGPVGGALSIGAVLSVPFRAGMSISQFLPQHAEIIDSSNQGDEQPGSISEGHNLEIEP